MTKYLIALLVFVSSCAQYPDSLPEELIEEWIEELTTLDIDLTSEEK